MAHRNVSFVSEDSGLSNLCFDLQFSLGHHFSVATQVCFEDVINRPNNISAKLKPTNT